MTRTRFLSLGRLNAQLLASRAALTASTGHLSVDLFTGMMPVILLMQRDAMGLSYSQVGLVSMTFSLSSSLTQPFFGLLGDRWGHGRLMVLGTTVASLAMSLMLMMDRFYFLIMLALVAGLASGAFHPQGAALAAQAPAERRGEAVSIFMLGGNSGSAFGPLLATVALALGGQYAPALLALLGLLFAAFVARLARAQARTHTAKPRGAGATPSQAALSLIVTVTLVVFMRSWIQSAISTYIPQLYAAQGASTTMAGSLLFAILLPLAIGGLLGGTLSDRVGRRRVLVFSTALAGPALWGVLHTGGNLPFLIGPVLGLAIGASVPVTIVMTQELVPRGLGLMSGIAMGLNFVSGAIGVWVTGIAADHIGLASAMSWSVLLPVAAAALALLLPSDRVENRVSGRTVASPTE